MKKKAVTTLLFTLLLTLGACTGTSEESPVDKKEDTGLTSSDDDGYTDEELLHPAASTDPKEIYDYIDAAGCDIDSWSGLSLTLEVKNEYFGILEYMSETITVTTHKGDLVVLDEYETILSAYDDEEVYYQYDYLEGGIIYTNLNGKVTHTSDSGTTLDEFKYTVIENYVYVLYLFESYITYQDDYLLDFTGSSLIEGDSLIQASLKGSQDYEDGSGYSSKGYVQFDMNYRKDLTVDSIYYDDYSLVDYGYGITVESSQHFEAEEYTDAIQIPDWL